MTVRGRISAARLGVTLMHEHLMVDFVGAQSVGPHRYDRDEVFQTVLPQLRRASQLGCQTLVECTPAGLGRDAALLERLSRATTLNLITPCGYYAAGQHAYVPAHAHADTAEQLAARWIDEFAIGIEGTGIKPGIIKIGVDAGPLSTLGAKLLRAAALTHLSTGLTICAHTGDGTAAFQQLDTLEQLGVRPDAFVWVHAQSEANTELHARAAARGCWIEFDGIEPSTVTQQLKFVEAMHARGLLHRTLISMDAGWYHVGEPSGGEFRSYESLFTDFLPRLRARLGKQAQSQLLVSNPRNALVLRVRALS